MSQMMVRYKVKPDQADRNVSLVQKVYEELHQAAPPDFHYATFVQEDGVSFVHVVSDQSSDERSPLMDIAAFRAFQENIADRCDEPPIPVTLREVGSYGFWGS
jgi:hypothetical protein